MLKTTKIFDEVFRRYDDLNASVQENVSAIRVVKAFVRESFEDEKFRNAADRLYRLFVRAEGILALNNPVMMLVVYGCIIAQRISSVQDADRILVLENGAVNGFDTHERLLENNRIYREIFEAQMKGGGDFDQPAPTEEGKEGESA